MFVSMTLAVTHSAGCPLLTPAFLEGHDRNTSIFYHLSMSRYCLDPVGTYWHFTTCVEVFCRFPLAISCYFPFVQICSFVPPCASEQVLSKAILAYLLVNPCSYVPFLKIKAKAFEMIIRVDGNRVFSLPSIGFPKGVQVEHEFYQFGVNIVLPFGQSWIPGCLFCRRSCCLWTYWVCSLAWTKPFCSRTTALCLAMWTEILDQLEVDFCHQCLLRSWNLYENDWKLSICWFHVISMLRLGRRCRALLCPMVRTKAPSGRPMPLCKTPPGFHRFSHVFPWWSLMHDAHNVRLKIWRLSARHCKVFFIVFSTAELLQSYAVTLPDTLTHWHIHSDSKDHCCGIPLRSMLGLTPGAGHHTSPWFFRCWAQKLFFKTKLQHFCCDLQIAQIEKVLLVSRH